MPYMTGMIQGWPGPTTAMEPGLVSIEAICMAYRQRQATSPQVETAEAVFKPGMTWCALNLRNLLYHHYHFCY